MITEWRAVAARLAMEFASGAAAVDPTEEACEYCALASLCRIEQPALAQPEIAEQDDDEHGGGERR